LVTTIDKEGIVETDGICIQFVPASTYAYTIAIHPLDRKKYYI
jgi:hypothetical protein